MNGLGSLAERVYPPVVHEQQDSFLQTLHTFFASSPLAIGFRYFRAESNIPLALTMNFRRQFQVYLTLRDRAAFGLLFVHNFIFVLFADEWAFLHENDSITGGYVNVLALLKAP